MTEREWLGCEDPIDMLLAPEGRAATERKVRLFLCGCCRRVWDLMSPGNRAAVELAERHADGLASAEELRRAEEDSAPCRDVEDEETLPEDRPPSFWCDVAAWKVLAGRAEAEATDLCDATRRPAGKRSGEWEEVVQARLLRCVLGNPFRPAAVEPAWLAWSGGTARSLAEAAYRERHLPSGELDPARLLVLSDALEEAGCTDADLLGHLRSPGPHVRGCWALDLILGRS